MIPLITLLIGILLLPSLTMLKVGSVELEAAPIFTKSSAELDPSVPMPMKSGLMTIFRLPMKSNLSYKMDTSMFTSRC